MVAASSQHRRCHRRRRPLRPSDMDPRRECFLASVPSPPLRCRSCRGPARSMRRPSLVRRHRAPQPRRPASRWRLTLGRPRPPTPSRYRHNLRHGLGVRARPGHRLIAWVGSSPRLVGLLALSPLAWRRMGYTLVAPLWGDALRPGHCHRRPHHHHHHHHYRHRRRRRCCRRRRPPKCACTRPTCRAGFFRLIIRCTPPTITSWTRLAGPRRGTLDGEVGEMG